jgi:DNA-binding transcriptional regulator YdaS (Cro superfamily)
MNLKTWCALVPGRQAELAAHLKVTPSAVSQALSEGKRIPPTWYRGIVDFTQDEVSFDDLVPAPADKQEA